MRDDVARLPRGAGCRLVITPRQLYNVLYAHYGDLRWWPADDPYEMMVGAVLTQNTAWRNVEKAIANFGGRLSPDYIASLPIDKLTEIIKPAGFFNQKAQYLKALTAWFAAYDYDHENAALSQVDDLRRQLLAVKGVGQETADSILLYALGLPAFVVDAYTMRLLKRLGVDVPMTYRGVQAWFTSQLPQDIALYNNYHACVVNICKDFCRAVPRCGGCPLASYCKSLC